MGGMDFWELISKDKHNYQNCSLPMNYLHGAWFPRMEDLLCQKFKKYQNKPSKPTNSENNKGSKPAIIRSQRMLIPSSMEKLSQYNGMVKY